MACMPGSVDPNNQTRALRWAAYFVLVIAALSSINWLTTIRQAYIAEHQWPSAGGTVWQMREDSRTVKPPSSRSRDYSVYWAEFQVFLDVPLDRCPGDIWQGRCVGTVKTPDVKSRALAVQWFLRHPRDSKVTVHYDPQTARMVLGGEPISVSYPWHSIVTTMIFFAVSAGLLVWARVLSDRNQSPGFDSPLEVDFSEK